MDHGVCECCGRNDELPYESRNGFQYCQACWDWGCTLDGNYCEYMADPTRYSKRTFKEAVNTDNTRLAKGPTDQEIDEAIASIRKEGGW